MKDRQFMTILGLVVAAGLVMGLIAFRMTAGTAAVATAAQSNVAAVNPNAPRPSAADEVVDPAVVTPPLASDAQGQNGEPSLPAKDPPEMQGPGTGDAPGTAADQPQQPGAPADTPGDATPQ